MKKFITMFIPISFLLTIFLLATPVYAANIVVSEDCSLEDAIKAANTDTATGGCPAGSDADTITLSADITLSRTLPQIISHITVEGSGFTISGGNKYRIFGVNGGILMINELTLKNAKADWGGAIYNINGTLTVNNSNINGSWAPEGGAIGNDGTLTINNSNISNNLAELGGAIYSLGGTLTINNSNFSGNTAKDSVGAIYKVDGTLSINNSNFNDNSATKSRIGAIFNENGRAIITNSTFSRNSSGYASGAVFNDKGTLSITTSNFNDNSAVRGGAIFNWYGTLDITNSSFNRNSVSVEGGAIYNGDELTITNSTFSRNSAEHSGGAIDNSEYGALTITNSAFSRNSAEDGGAIDNESGRITITDSTFSDNSASNEGGGLYIESGSANMIHVTLVNNSAKEGGGLYRDAGTTVNLHNSIIAGNTGSDCFGRLEENIGSLIEDGSCFTALNGDPMLDKLVTPKNGSPAYYLLLEGSPAIDAAHPDYCTPTDQIGTARPQGAGCDIGAIEIVPD